MSVQTQPNTTGAIMDACRMRAAATGLLRGSASGDGVQIVSRAAGRSASQWLRSERTRQCARRRFGLR